MDTIGIGKVKLEGLLSDAEFEEKERTLAYNRRLTTKWLSCPIYSPVVFIAPKHLTCEYCGF
jgi:hypothetical protein